MSGFAAIKLKIFTVWNSDGDEWQQSWSPFHEAWRKYQQSVQKGMGDVLLHIRDLRAQGKTRFPTSEEKKSGDIPPECYSADDLKKFARVLYHGMKSCGLASNIYSQSSKIISDSEFNGPKLASLLQGKLAYPVMKSPKMHIHNEHYTVHFEERTKEFKDGTKKTFEVPIIEIKNLYAGGKPVQLECWALTGRGHESKLAILKAIAEEDEAVSKLNTKQKKARVASPPFKKGAVSILRMQKPGQGVEWYVQLPYKSLREEEKDKRKSVLIVHRGVANALCATVIEKDSLRVHYYGGHRIVLYKSQMHARRRKILQDVHSMTGRGKGHSYRHRALSKLGSKEKDFTRTEIWRMAKWVQNLAEKNNVELLVIEKFNSFGSDISDNDRYMPAYIRKWPYAELKSRIQDVCKRRIGKSMDVREVEQMYISQTCPFCGHKNSENIRSIPHVGIQSPACTQCSQEIEKNHPHTHRDGRFKCSECGYAQNLDYIACLNMALESDIPKWCKSSIEKALKKEKRFIDRARIHRLNEKKKFIKEQVG